MRSKSSCAAPRSVARPAAPRPVRVATAARLPSRFGPKWSPTQTSPSAGRSANTSRSISTSRSSAAASDELGKEVSQADKQIGQHLQQVFDHRVSKLEAVPGEAAAPPAAYEPPDLVGAAADIPDTFATGLLDLITSPDSLRQAIILSEILHRPEERWG